jgi:hypothetical protein
MNGPRQEFTLTEARQFFGISGYRLNQWITRTTAARGEAAQPRNGKDVTGQKGSAKILTLDQMVMIAEECDRAREADLLSMAQSGDEWLQQVSPTKNHAWVTSYPGRLPTVLDVLNNSSLAESPRHVLVMVGVKGSPKRDMAKAITDYLDQPASDRPGRRNLQPYRSVYVLDCRRLDAVMSNPPGLDAAAVMARIRSTIPLSPKTSRDRVVLVLDPVPVLLRTPETRRLWTALAQATDIAVLGTLDPIEDQQALSALENMSPVQVDNVVVNKTTLEDTYRILRTHWYPEWHSAGFAFENHAFDHVIALEPGARVNGSRMTLPYLAVEMGQQAINHVEDELRGDHVLVRDFASALQHIKNLLSSIEVTSDLAAILEDAEEEITTASADIGKTLSLSERKSHSGQSVKILPQAYVTAQLLSMNSNSFQWEDVSS